MNKKLSFLTLLGAIVSPALALATDGGDITITGMVDAAVQTTLYIASGIVVILWIVTGILFLTAQGDPAKLKTAKSSLFAAVAGTVLVIVAASAISLVKSMFGLN